MVAALHKLTFLLKNVKNGDTSLKNSKYKEIESDSKYKIVKNLVMELKNANSKFPMVAML